MSTLNIGLTKSGRAQWQEADENKKRFQFCNDPSGQEILYLRALQGHSGRNPIDPSLQDNVLIPNNFFEYIYHIGCAINFTLQHEFRIDTGRTQFGQKTDGILHICGSYEQRTQRSWCNRPGSTASCMVQAEKWKIHQDTVYIKLAQQKRIWVLSDTIERHHPLRHTPSLLYPEGDQDGNWRNQKRESICVTRPPPKISFKDNWRKDLGSEVVGNGEDSQRTQPKTTNPIVRTGKPVSEQPTGLFTQLEEIEIDFRVSGLPHAVVKQAENFRVHQLVKKIESHPHREALQAELQQNKVYNPFVTIGKLWFVKWAM